MKAYVVTTGILFGLVVLVHLWRVIEEGAQLMRDPWHVATTLLAALLFGWAVRLLRGMRRESGAAS